MKTPRSLTGLLLLCLAAFAVADDAPQEIVHCGLDFSRHPDAHLAGPGVMLPPIIVSQFCGACEPAMRVLAFALLPTWASLVHPALTAYPTRGVGVAQGYDAAYLFDDGERGVLVNPRLGLRVEPTGRFRLESGVNHQNHWNWRGASRSFGWGWYLKLSVSADLVGAAVPRGGYD